MLDNLRKESRNGSWSWLLDFTKMICWKCLTFSSSDIIVFIIHYLRYFLKTFCSSVGGGVGSVLRCNREMFELWLSIVYLQICWDAQFDAHLACQRWPFLGVGPSNISWTKRYPLMMPKLHPWRSWNDLSLVRFAWMWLDPWHPCMVCFPTFTIQINQM